MGDFKPKFVKFSSEVSVKLLNKAKSKILADSTEKSLSDEETCKRALEVFVNE